MKELLRINDLSINLSIPAGTVGAVSEANFRVEAGSCVALVGESGAGKSVTAEAIMGILPKNASIKNGQILFSDPAANGTTVDIAKLGPNSKIMRQIRGGRISMIFQEPMTSLSPLHTIGDQIIEALQLHQNCNRREAIGRTRDMLKRVGFPNPSDAVDYYPFELSGGLRQRAMIAMALVCQPALLIADEPTTALDVTIQAQILKLLSDLRSDLGMAVLIITHDLGVVANMADEVIVLHNGKIVESGTRNDLFRNPQHEYVKALFKAVPRIGLGQNERLKPIHGIERNHEKYFPPNAANIRTRSPIGTETPLLKVRNLHKVFHLKRNKWFRKSLNHSVKAVNEVSFNINRGECLALVGESGSGKTTLAKLIVRALTPNKGSLTYLDNNHEIDVLALSGFELSKFRKKIQYIFQDPFSSLDPRMTALDTIVEPLVIHKLGSRSSRREIASELMRLVGLEEGALGRYPHSFSGGQRQRIGIARALALKPELLICDEPVSALDVGIQAQILNLLGDLQRELHLTYLFVSHNLAVVKYIADRIAVMCRGRLVEIASKEDLFKRPTHPYTQKLISAVPDINLENPLDFDELLGERTSEPAAWPGPFRDDGLRKLTLRQIGAGHFVRAANTDQRGQKLI
tara:strand:- start:545 stop:2443 length:1899 start_codon:yes stop_codon:yes gene_type:complete